MIPPSISYTMEIVIYSPFDCLIKTQNDEMLLDQNEHIIFEDKFEKIDVYPVNKNSRYSFSIDLDKESSPFYSIIKQPDKILIFLLDGLIAENVDLFDFSYNGNESNVEIGKNQIIFKSNEHKKTITLPNEVTDVKCGNFKHINYVTFKDEEKCNIIAYNVTNNKTKLFQGENIEITDNGFVITNERNNFYKKIVEEYIVDEQGLKSKSKVFSQKESFPDSLVPYMFMNSLKLKDYENAIQFLSDELKNKLNPQALKNYFGDISYFYIIDQTTAFAIANGKNLIYSFKTSQNKIYDILDSEN